MLHLALDLFQALALIVVIYLQIRARARVRPIFSTAAAQPLNAVAEQPTVQPRGFGGAGPMRK